MKLLGAAVGAIMGPLTVFFICPVQQLLGTCLDYPMFVDEALNKGCGVIYMRSGVTARCWTGVWRAEQRKAPNAAGTLGAHPAD